MTSAYEKIGKPGLNILGWFGPPGWVMGAAIAGAAAVADAAAGGPKVIADCR